VWHSQQRLYSAWRSDAAGDADENPYRDVFAALGREYLPPLPGDFAARMAADAQRLADARAQVSRFKRLLASLLGFLYLPTMLAVAVFWGGDLLRSFQSHNGSWSWIAVLMALTMASSIIGILMRRYAAGVSGD
jgi:hypothetical protein